MAVPVLLWIVDTDGIGIALGFQQLSWGLRYEDTQNEIYVASLTELITTRLIEKTNYAEWPAIDFRRMLMITC